MIWEDAVSFALSLPDTELGRSFGKPSVNVKSNGRSFLFPSHEADTSFGLALDIATIEMLKATDPKTFWQTPHYEGWPGVLVRYETADNERVREVISRSRNWAATRPKSRSRSR